MVNAELKTESFDVNSVAKQVAAIKKISPSMQNYTFQTLTNCVASMSQYRKFVARTVAARAVRYDSNSADHESLLEAV